jgi:hypothetical protein
MGMVHFEMFGGRGEKHVENGQVGWRWKVNDGEKEGN